MLTHPRSNDANRLQICYKPLRFKSLWHLNIDLTSPIFAGRFCQLLCGAGLTFTLTYEFLSYSTSKEIATRARVRPGARARACRVFSRFGVFCCKLCEAKRLRAFYPGRFNSYREA